MQITLFERYILTMPQGTISDAGIQALLDLILSQRLQNDDWKALNPMTTLTYLPVLPNDWEWAWVVARGEYAGTFTKRIRSYFFKAHGVKCPDKFIQDVGSIARAHSGDAITYSFEFVDKFEWSAGDFGDKGSCYWGSHSGAKDMLTENGAWAICFYNADGNGVARAWVYEIEAGLFIVWNGYGFPNATLTIARVFAAFMSATYKKVELANNGMVTGTLYINSNAGFLVGDVETLAGMDAFDFEWDDLDMETCSDCGDNVPSDDAYHFNGDTYCQSCYSNNFTYCERCGEDYPSDDMYYVELTERDYCETCVYEEFTRCSECDEWVRLESVFTDESSDTSAEFCETCWQERQPPPPEQE